MAALLFTAPDTLEVGSAEVYPLAIDMTSLLATGENADNPSCTLVDLVDGSSYPAGILAASVATNGKLVDLVLTSLAPGHRYRLITTCRPNATSNKTVEAASIIFCPF